MSDSYSVKKITELTENTTSHDTDLFVLGNEGTATMRKVSFSNLATWVKTKISALVSSDIVNNATTNASDKVASAAVAKSLQDQITTLNSKISNYVTVGNFGKEQTLAGNSSNAVDIPITTPTGYTNLVAIPIDSGAASCFVRSASFTSSTNVRCYVDNVGSASRTPTVRVSVLFYKGA